jgi:hypothetical protein
MIGEGREERGGGEGRGEGGGERGGEKGRGEEREKRKEKREKRKEDSSLYPHSINTTTNRNGTTNTIPHIRLANRTTSFTYRSKT